MSALKHSSAHTPNIHHAASQARPWGERLARLGYLVKGLVYLILGYFAIQAASGSGSGTTNTNGVFAYILRHPFGHFLLGIVVIGLACYSLWRLCCALFNAESESSDTKGRIARVGYLASCLIYAFLSWSAYRMLTRGQGQQSGQTHSEATRLLAAPEGHWIMGLVGLALIATALYQIYAAIKAKFQQRMKLAELTNSVRKGLINLGRLGYVGRAIVLAIIGWYAFLAAWTHNASKAVGVHGAQTAITHHSGGPWLLGLVAAGLIAYGAFMIAEARYHVIDGN